jgi:thiol:disulfide interchange protein DsbC
MAFPRAGVGSHSYDKAVSVWCAKDQQDALTQAKLGAEPAPLKCDNPVDEQYKLGRDLGVSGTPSLLTADGQMIPGYVPPEQLRARLEQMAAVQAE